MAKYKVIKGNVGGFGGKTFDEGSICSDTDFPVGNAQDLEKMGYLELLAESDTKFKVVTITVDPTVISDKDTDETDSDETDSDTDEKPLSIRSMNKGDIIQILVMKGVEFTDEMNKEELYELYVKNF